MVKVSIMYPDTPGLTFDMDYYLQTHMPMSIARLSAHPGFHGVSVERGVPAPQSGLPPPYVALCHFLFTSADDFAAAFMPHAAALQADIANYTAIAPVVQFSAVEITQAR
jgi:uncharacterized protein (TIGR02118 family)